jgi:hypothetical protein
MYSDHFPFFEGCSDPPQNCVLCLATQPVASVATTKGMEEGTAVIFNTKLFSC